MSSKLSYLRREVIAADETKGSIFRNSVWLVLFWTDRYSWDDIIKNQKEPKKQETLLQHFMKPWPPQMKRPIYNYKWVQKKRWICECVCVSGSVCLCVLICVSSEELCWGLIVAVAIEQTDHWTKIILVQNHLCILLAL